MIFDRLENINNYRINEAFEVFKTRLVELDDFTQIEAPFKAIPLEYSTGKFDLSKFENHKKFIDVHYVVSGVELIGISDIENVKPNMEYDQENDYQLFDGKVMKTIILKEGEFLLLFPGEVHVTGGYVDNLSIDLKKVVFKVPVL